jgi:putative endonuclease
MRDRTYYVYIMSSLSRTLYTGVSNDLERRVVEHREGRAGSFTARYKVNRLAYFEEFSDIREAIAREKEIKLLTRKRKIRLIESMNPSWNDLSREQGKPPARRDHPENTGILRAAATRENDKGAAHTLTTAGFDSAETKPMRW